MITVDMKALIGRLGDQCTAVLHAAAGLAVSRTHYEVTVEHFLRAALDQPACDVALMLSRSLGDTAGLTRLIEGALEDLKAGNTGKPVFSPLLIELLQSAWLLASVDLEEGRIRTGAVLAALADRPSLYAAGRLADVFRDTPALSRQTLESNFWTLVKGSSEASTQLTAREVQGAGDAAGGAASGTPGAPGGSFTARYCTDFTARAREGGIDAVFGRDAEIRQIVDILARRRKNNPILLGEPGVGKTAVIEGLALRVAQGDVPELLAGVSLLGLDMGALEAGAGMKGEFENRLRGVIEEIKASEKPIILFIDEAHTLIGAGGSAGTSDAANLLKPALARGELRTCAATTWKEYKKYFEKDPALERRFQPVKLDPPSAATTALILRGLRAAYEKSHKVVIRDDAIQAAADYADRYITGRFLPDKAIDLLDTSCARVKVNLTAKPPALEDKEREAQALERERRALERDRDNNVAVDAERLAAIAERQEILAGDLDALAQRWQAEREAVNKVLDLRGKLAEAAGAPAASAEAPEAAPAGDSLSGVADLKAALDAADAALAEVQGEKPLIRIEVSPELVAQVVSDWTGIPVGKVARDQAATMLRLDERLRERIMGQNHALAVIGDVMRSAGSGIRDPRQPMGVFLLVGPSGVGKTETGLSLAELLFGSEKAVVSVNMSEFQEKHTVSRLIGSPPGYVGYGEGGMLTEAVRRHPYSVVLLDEVEKAHPDVMNIFYQVFDKGVLTDGEGKEIDFANTIILLTSNLASDVIQEMTAQAPEGEDAMPTDAVLGAVRPILSQHFKPALLARMTIAPYYSLRGKALQAIVRLKLDKVRSMLMQNNRMDMSWDDAVVAAIAERCTEVETGARNVDFILRGKVLPQMSREILGHMTDGGLPSSVRVLLDDDGGFRMDYGFDPARAAGGAREAR